MHELPITQSIVNICSEEVEKHNSGKVTKIKIKIGELSGIVPECIQTYFDIISSGTKVEGAQLDIEKVPLKFKCSTCGFSGNMDLNVDNCPSCGSNELKISGGNEFYIDSMEVEDGD